jgi:cytochrome c2
MRKNIWHWGLSLCLLLSACPGEQTQKIESSAASQQPISSRSAVPIPTPNLHEGSKIFITKGCIACHAVSQIPEAKGVIGPKLDQIALTASSRVKGLTAEAYLRQSIEKPSAFLVPGYQNLMTPNLRMSMTTPEFEDLIGFLLSLE